MKYKILILTTFCLIGIIFKSNDCSPIQTPFKKLLDSYNQNQYIIVEGYFKASKESRYATEFKVLRSSDSSIIKGQKYEVFEYGPFGSACEMYEMKSKISLKLTGKKNSRLLIVYKDQSVNGKLVTPIFWEAGVNTSNDKIVTEIHYSMTGEYIPDEECSTSLNKIWKQILNGNVTTSLKWKKLTNTSKTKH